MAGQPSIERLNEALSKVRVPVITLGSGVNLDEEIKKGMSHAAKLIDRVALKVGNPEVDPKMVGEQAAKEYMESFSKDFGDSVRQTNMHIKVQRKRSRFKRSNL
ncbi:hypothetical protein VTG60DRAFT_324 [Thermothelomyces hinnuleus]